MFVVWVLIQLTALLLASLDVRLTAQGTPGARSLALQMLLMVQITGAALMLGGLLANIRAAGLAFALAFPLTQVAASLSGSGSIAGLKVSLVLGVWLGALLCWRFALPGRDLLLAGLMSTWVLGSAVLVYLVMEFGRNAVLAEVLWDMAPLLLAGQFPGSPALPGLLMVNLVLSFAAIAARRRVESRESE